MADDTDIPPRLEPIVADGRRGHGAAVGSSASWSSRKWQPRTASPRTANSGGTSAV
ncbi:hypothetical protein ACFQH2_17065 [Natronoarchaeum sp. GCM10025703]|uniref:hypothetical protein n=1 Tax=Natronoarchaeum sp. GCM10025703 TaxID=3252685 RepID=UPI00360B46AF